MPQKIYPRSKDRETVYLKNVVSNLISLLAIIQYITTLSESQKILKKIMFCINIQSIRIN